MALAHHDIFRHHLAIKYPVYGHALWEPSPGDSFPAVEIGDVGFIREGRFHRLFNILLPAEDPSHENYGVPEYHEQLTLHMRNHIIRGTLGPNNLCSDKVTSQPVPRELAMGPDSPAEIVFSCKRKQGAVLYLPTEARCENTIALGDFGKWMIKHIDSWFSWVRLLGVGINRIEDVVLVTGTHRTRSWTNVAFPGGQADGLVSFGANVATRGEVVTVNWKFSHEYSRGAVLNYGPNGEDLPEDQCIFIRGFRVARKLVILPRGLKAAAGPNPDTKGDDYEPNIELMSIQAVPEYRDPLHMILEYIMEEAPSCNMALVHDDDLARIDGLGDDTLGLQSLEALEPNAILRLLRSSAGKPKVHDVPLGADSFSSSSIANADVEIPRVATLSTIFEEIGPAPSSMGMHGATKQQSAEAMIPPSREGAFDFLGPEQHSAQKLHVPYTGRISPRLPSPHPYLPEQDALYSQFRLGVSGADQFPAAYQRNRECDAAERLIRIIRERRGYDDAHSTPSPAVSGLRHKLERALVRLSSDLYNKKMHFLLEFIQNADDNAYADDVIPSLKLTIEQNLIVFECNELGFSADNVRAICDIGASTKTHENSTRGFIGEKGIGFKSVFTIANEVHISSGPYSFHFDRTTKLGMITPVWGSAYPPTPGWTTFHLRLAPSENGSDLSTQLSDLRPVLLLFLRQLRSLVVTLPGAAGHRALKIYREDGPGDDLVSLTRVDDGQVSVEKYLLVKHVARTPGREPGREGVEQSEIMLAFPVSETGEPVIKMQDVHAFLPLRRYGFNFIIQADFITSASGEDLLVDKEWNNALRNSVIDTFLLAVERFADHPTLRNVWFRYLPESISNRFFCYVEHKLILELQRRPILRSSDGTYFRASQLILPASFRDDVGAPLIPEEHLPRGLHYLSSDYGTHDRDGLILRRLGVHEMTDDDFLNGLKNVDQAGLFSSKSAAWHECIATCILRLQQDP